MYNNLMLQIESIILQNLSWEANNLIVSIEAEQEKPN